MQSFNNVAASADRLPQLEGPDWKSAFVARIEKLPTLAAGCRELYFYLLQRQCTSEGAAELVGVDPLLAVEVVRSSKSAVYGSRGANSIKDAVQAIGLERLGRIALRIWLRNLIPSHLAVYNLDGGHFMRRSFACGAAMRYLYQGDTEQSETAYAIGLLHGIGRVVVAEVVRLAEDEDLVFMERTSRRLAEAELSEFGVTHAEVGGLALKTWGFSELIHRPIAAQFSKDAAKDKFDWTQSLAISRFIADRVQESLSGVANPLRGEGRAVYRGKTLSELFEYTLAMVEEEAGPDQAN
ncbi:HDOD domain-containing protein [Pelagicoccus sp. SDUM812005]|uniref:HDOD domain-containing protein n=1 Tax=Pelagicoccus sp. SDUM812005 TaxID=3041257 RepID=UPI00280D8CEB|nr:HDOD domain-containing protein [Pelagicoccus sp. SDUM812005]MDQ8179470.1 HDOD domain-containing protein [Pelagicoccus sp. SDUM812005]